MRRGEQVRHRKGCGVWLILRDGNTSFHAEEGLIRNDASTTMATAAGARLAPLDCPTVSATARTEFDDEPLVKAAQGGDRAAFGELYQRYARMVHGVLLARVPRSAAEDLVHDVFLLALPRLKSLRDTARFGAWLAAIARNRAVDFHRRAKPDSCLEDHVAAVEGMEKARSRVAVEDGMALRAAGCEMPAGFCQPLIPRGVS